MEMLKGENIGYVPFKGLKKISDLIYFEGPVLSHFRDDFGKDVLFYWVDYNHEVNRWIIFQITEIQLGEYLTQKKTLFSLFQNPFNNIFYSLEIGVTLEYKNVTQIFNGDLPIEYLPETDSKFSEVIPPIYNKIVQQVEDTYAKVLFMDSSLFIKAEPSNGENLNLVGVLDGADFLYGVGNSFKGLIEFETTKEFAKRGITDSKRIEKIKTALVKSMQPNLVELKAASFAVALSPNSYTDVGEDFLNKAWRDYVFNKFKTDIVEIDKKGSEDIDSIVETYGDTTAIYKPLIELYNNKKLTISITDKEFVSKRTIRPIKKEYIQKLVPKKPKNQEEPEDRIAKVKINATTGKIAGPAGMTLFDTSIFTSWKTMEIITDKKRFKLKRALVSDYKIENRMHIIENEDLQIYASGDSKPEAETNFYEVFGNLYKELIEVDNIKLSARELEIKRYMQFYL